RGRCKADGPLEIPLSLTGSPSSPRVHADGKAIALALGERCLAGQVEAAAETLLGKEVVDPARAPEDDARKEAQEAAARARRPGRGRGAQARTRAPGAGGQEEGREKDPGRGKEGSRQGTQATRLLAGSREGLHWLRPFDVSIFASAHRERCSSPSSCPALLRR